MAGTAALACLHGLTFRILVKKPNILCLSWQGIVLTSTPPLSKQHLASIPAPWMSTTCPRHCCSARLRLGHPIFLSILLPSENVFQQPAKQHEPRPYRKLFHYQHHVDLQHNKRHRGSNGRLSGTSTSPICCQKCHLSLLRLYLFRHSLYLHHCNLGSQSHCHRRLRWRSSSPGTMSLRL